MTVTGQDQRTLWVTGAGSGIGRAVAVSAGRSGYRVGVSGRRPDALDETVSLVEQSGGRAIALPLDVRSDDEVRSGHARLTEAFGPVTDLVAAAGLNAKRRYWRDQSRHEFEDIVQVNLMGSVRVIDAVLPGMRSGGRGTVVIVSSYAAWTASPHAGVAYSASKTALSTLALSLNAQESSAGIRCTHLCPGEVDTDFLSLRPEVPDGDARRRMLSPDDVARSVQFVLDSPAHVTIDELVISPVPQKR
ncbi:SDR family oxidoreductase [Lysobacter korlensis]|uniref:SDR family oxidoreductase n=1 Tax=Lysobacter korlensis TaxID=553636 RepID=A0ABV6S3I6_9GAMM